MSGTFQLDVKEVMTWKGGKIVVRYFELNEAIGEVNQPDWGFSELQKGRVVF